jgi:DNA-binding response OmpR family regulator
VKRTVHPRNRRIDLTQKEFALLEYLMRNANTLLLYGWLANSLYGHHDDEIGEDAGRLAALLCASPSRSGDSPR